MGTFGGTHLSEGQIYQHAVQAGFPAGQWAELATATAMTESGGWTGAVSDTGATGLYQIIHGHWPAGMTQAQAEDPATNSKMAYALFQGRGGTGVSPSRAFADWWPYDGGPSNKNWGTYLAAAQAAANDPTGAGAAAAGAGLGPSGAAGSDLGGTVTSIQPLLDAISGFISPAGNIGSGQVDTIVGGQFGPAITGAMGIAKGVTSWLSGIVGDADQFLKAVLWLVNPANEIRVLMAVIGLVFFGAGAWLLIREVRT